MKDNIKIRDIFFSVLSAGLLILASAKPFIWGFGWIGFIPLFFAIQDKSKLQAFLLSWLSGVLFFFGAIYWLSNVTFAGLVILAFYLGLYFAAFGLFFSIYYKPSLKNLSIISSLWIILEYIRTYVFTGFGWAILGYSQSQVLPIIQIADITGVYGVSFLMILVNLAIYSFIRYKQKCLSVIFIILIVTGYGYFRVNEKISSSNLKVSIIQGNVLQEMKWNKDCEKFIKDKYFSLTKKAILDNPDLIIWPEAGVPELLSWPHEAQVYFSSIDFKPLVAGALVIDNNKYYNSAILVEKNKLERYDKLHLVPFGEYVPLKNFLPFLETVVGIGDFTRGSEYRVFFLKDNNRTVKFSTLICFEDIFPDIAAQFTQRGANFLVNMTNDAWFGDTSAPFQHMSFSVFRAVENKRAVVRAANTGISCFISPCGKVYSGVCDDSGKKTFIEGIDTKDIVLSNQKTFYSKFGDVFVLLSMLFFAINFYKK